jgi:hypothetical protein
VIDRGARAGAARLSKGNMPIRRLMTGSLGAGALLVLAQPAFAVLHGFCGLNAGTPTCTAQGVITPTAGTPIGPFGFTLSPGPGQSITLNGAPSNPLDEFLVPAKSQGPNVAGLDADQKGSGPAPFGANTDPVLVDSYMFPMGAIVVGLVTGTTYGTTVIQDLTPHSAIPVAPDYGPALVLALALAVGSLVVFGLASAGFRAWSRRRQP